MRLKRFNTYILIIAALLLVVACKTRPAPASRNSISERYPLRPEYSVFQADTSSTLLYFRVQTSDLLYTRSESEDFSAYIRLSYRVSPVDAAKQVTDSGSIRLTDVRRGQEARELNGEIPLSLEWGKNYRLHLTLQDQKRGSKAQTELLIYKTNTLNRQFFKVSDYPNGRLAFNAYPAAGQVQIYAPWHSGKSLSIRYYRRRFGSAPPPFADFRFQSFNYSADSLFTASLDAEGYARLTLNPDGFYHILTDTSSRDGLTLFVMPDYFPKVSTSEMLMDPLRYICSSAEYVEIKNATDKKLAVDNFWLQRSGSRERARELIRQFYSRIEEANRLYTSYIEGWKTDRGMISLIFGEPPYKERGEQAEVWIYGDRYSSASLRFNFAKVNNPFTDNDYFLQRSPAYKPAWYKAVETWRSGRAYSYSTY